MKFWAVKKIAKKKKGIPSFSPNQLKNHTNKIRKYEKLVKIGH